jgi:cytosine/adenosine deaminase-related metal-dependent hydrolase
MTLVYCPRTHAYFGHSPYPLFQALQSGVHVALGTDSKASNPDLNLLTDMRFARQQHPAVTGDQILRMGTLHGAQALSAADRLGSLSVGKRASWIAVELPERDDPDPHDLVFQSLLPVSLVVVDGKPVYAQGKMGAFLKKWREEAGTG